MVIHHLESFKILKQIGDGTFKKWIPKMGIGLVDVRDVAKAHISALENAMIGHISELQE